MNRINPEPLIRGPRDAVDDSREIRSAIRVLQFEVSELVFGEATSASALGTLAYVMKLELEDGTELGYLPIYDGYTP